MTHEELEAYRDRFENILKCQDEHIKVDRLMHLKNDLKYSYSIPGYMQWGQFSKLNPEVATLYKEVVDALPI